MVPVIVAHQGGWDEALLVLVPVAVFAGLLTMANRRAKAIQRQRQADRTSATDGTDGTDGTTSPDHPDSGS
jgi:hypothetical protein